MNKEVKGKKAATKLRRQVRSQVQLGNEGKGTVARRSTATTLAEPRPDGRGYGNPLLDLPDEDRAKLYLWLRECPYHDAVQHVLADRGIEGVTPRQLDEFFQSEAQDHWEMRIQRAAIEANALVQLVERSPVKFSSGILAALGQEAFRQISSGEVEPGSMGRLATLFLKARSDERADQMQELKRQKLRNELKGQINLALERLVEEVEKHPEAREAFAAVQREMQKSLQDAEEA